MPNASHSATLFQMLRQRFSVFFSSLSYNLFYVISVFYGFAVYVCMCVFYVRRATVTLYVCHQHWLEMLQSYVIVVLLRRIFLSSSGGDRRERKRAFLQHYTDLNFVGIGGGLFKYRFAICWYVVVANRFAVLLSILIVQCVYERGVVLFAHLSCYIDDYYVCAFCIHTICASVNSTLIVFISLSIPLSLSLLLFPSHTLILRILWSIASIRSLCHLGYLSHSISSSLLWNSAHVRCLCS